MEASAWQLIFECLSLRDIISCCRACTTLANAAHAFVCRRQYDAAEGREGYIVPYENWVDNMPYADIKYVSENVLASGVKVREAYGPITTEQCDCSESSEDSGVVQSESVEGTRYHLRKKDSLDDNKASFQVCSPGLCSCGIDLQNEVAYDDDGRLLALLAPQLNPDFPEALQYDSSESLPSLHPTSPESGSGLGSFKSNEVDEVVGEPSALCPLSMEHPKKKRKKIRDRESASIKNLSETSSVRGQPTVKTSCSKFQKTCEKLEESEHAKVKESERKKLEQSEHAVDSMPNGGESLVVFECGPSCRCGLECSNRLTQRGLAARVKVVKHRQKGWCLHAAEDIRRGAFICQYAGELLTNVEADRRHLIYDSPEYHSSGRPRPALLVVREHLPSKTASLRLNIDATHFGNVARFINHSCDGGNASRVLVRQRGWPLPHVALFANREILAGEEITMSYGEVKADESTLQTAPPCYCGASNCIGVMPRDLA